MRYLAIFLLLVTGCTPTPGPTPAPTPTPPPAKPTTPVEKMEADLITAHTTARNGQALIADAKLTTMARDHAQFMADTKQMTHNLPASFASRFKVSGYIGSGGGENIAAGQRDVPTVMRAWLNSAGHRRNILGDWTHIGVGVAASDTKQLYWCVVFGRSYASTAEHVDTTPPGITAKDNE